jgi:hypothetical protein
MVIFCSTLELREIAALTILRGLRHLHILDHTYKRNVSPVTEHIETFPQASQLKALSMPLSLWYMFPHGVL